MVDQQEDEDLKMALRMSMQEPPEPKRRSGAAASFTSDESPDSKSRRLQRELMAAAAEKRMQSAGKSASASPSKAVKKSFDFVENEKEIGSEDLISWRELSIEEADQLFSMVFGGEVSKGIITQWTNQGIRFSLDPETSMGLVQHEGGPCGVLATLQAFVLKYLLFSPNMLGKAAPNTGPRRLSKDRYVASETFSSPTEEAKERALVRSMCEILFMCGNNKQAVIATFHAVGSSTHGTETNQKDENIASFLEGRSIESASDLQRILRVDTYTAQDAATSMLELMIPVFRSRMGALLFLISALLSRGLDSIQADRDDPSLPLVTAPFGHASQEIVNLLLCGEAVANVFDGRMDLGGGMFLKGVSKSVEVGFLTLLESLNFCKVGQNLKCPNWPIWVVGSESHYTVLFALDTAVQDENEFEQRESQIKRAFDEQDQSGGGGFISVEAFHQVLRDTNVRLTPEKLDSLCSSGFIVWSEFWQVIMDLDRSSGGLKDSTGMMGKKIFDLYHFNGIAKSDLNGGLAMAVEGEVPTQRPRLTKLRVSVPPKWTPEEYMAMPSVSGPNEKDSEVNKPEPSQHAPLVDCVRTRWPRATCNWHGDPPSIV